MGTIKRNDLRTNFKVKELISNARSIEDLGAKTKEQEEEREERKFGQEQVVTKTCQKKLLHLMNVLGYL